MKSPSPKSSPPKGIGVQELDLDAALQDPLSLHANELCHIDGHRSRGGNNQEYSIDMPVHTLQVMKNNARKTQSKIATRTLKRPDTDTRNSHKDDFLSWDGNPLEDEEHKAAYLSARNHTPLSPNHKKKMWDLHTAVGGDSFQAVDKWEKEREFQLFEARATARK